MVNTPQQVSEVQMVEMVKAHILEMVKALLPVSLVNQVEPCMRQVEKVAPPITLHLTSYLRTPEMAVTELAVPLNLPRGALASLLFVMQGGWHNGKVDGFYQKWCSY